MRILRAIWARFLSWFAWEKPVRPLKTVHADELPDVLDSAAVYVLGESEYCWFVAMTCPCGCKSILQMSLLADAKPRWRLTEHGDGTVTLHPSVWRTEGCRSHFFLRHGFIKWCPVSNSRE